MQHIAAVRRLTPNGRGRGKQSDDRRTESVPQPRSDGGNPDCAACAFAITSIRICQAKCDYGKVAPDLGGQPGTAAPGLSAARDKAAADQLAVDLVGAFP